MNKVIKTAIFLLLLFQCGLAAVYAETAAEPAAHHEPIVLLPHSHTVVTQDVYQAIITYPFDDQDSSATPAWNDGSTMAPLRFVAEHFGATVDYQNSQSIQVVGRDRKLTLALDESTIISNQMVIYMSAKTVLKNNTTYVPLKEVAEALGEQVQIEQDAIYIGDSTDEASLRQTITVALPFLRTGLPYLVYQGANLLDGFLTQADAITYAKLWSSSSVQTRDGQLLWQYSTMKPIYLSFDDGPDEYTPLILDTLAKYKIHATFFMLGPHIDKYPGTVKRMINEGNAVGLHGVTHDYKLIYRTPQTVVNEMDSANRSLKKATGFTTDVIRVPYGSVPYMKQDYRDATVKAGYHLWDWNVDSTDSLGADTPTIIKTTIQQISKQATPIVLFHDKKATLQSLPAVLDYLVEHNYDFKTIDSTIPPINFWKDTR
jgi:peptidoglycan/xylan/chitin deacetylase (PgdA/CDA1 family)